ncbi:MAG: hypothetical protein M5U12_09920 [Verrucomicrobia bacterium]|nr:hypothetical protein [Verrucomicrobiota bacterium]
MSAATTTAGFSLASVERAIERAQANLFHLQHPEGYWVGELLVDCTILCDLLIFRHWDRSVNVEWERKAVRQIFALQTSEGGWNLYHGGPAEVNATIKAYLALKLAGVPVTDPGCCGRARSP